LIKREESRHDFAFMTGVVIGAVAGALATLALAPRTGTETRDRWRTRMQEMLVEDLRARASGLREVAAARSEQLREAASSASASDVVRSTRSRVTDMVDRSPLPVTLGDDAANDESDAAETLMDAADDAQDTAASVASDAAEEADTVIEEAAAGATDALGNDAEDETKS